MLFHKVEGAAVVLRCKGVFRQVDVYQRSGELFAKWGGGFIGLRRGDGTTKPEVLWDYLDGVQWEEGSLGKLFVRGTAVKRAA